MKGFHGNIEQLSLDNDTFRTVLYTGKHLQLVVMSIPVGGEIGQEVHDENDQFIRIEQGTGKAIIDGNEYELADGDVVLIPQGAEHNVLNTSRDTVLKLYTLYGPSHHEDGTVQATKEEADADDEHFDGKTTE